MKYDEITELNKERDTIVVDRVKKATFIINGETYILDQVTDFVANKYRISMRNSLISIKFCNKCLKENTLIKSVEVILDCVESSNPELHFDLVCKYYDLEVYDFDSKFSTDGDMSIVLTEEGY